MSSFLIFLLPVVFSEVDYDQGNNRVVRGSPSYAANWPLPIPFAINNGYKDDAKEKIRAGIKTIMENTCIDFVEDSGPGQKLEYINTGKCSSIVGDSRGKVAGNHTVNLDLGCLNIGNVQHETTHALGFDHTQNRADRDEYITVRFENINDPVNFTKNFEIVNLNDYVDYGIPYDYASRMHYLPGEFGKLGTVVLDPKDPDYLMSMGTSKVHTFYDWKMINVRYNCGGNCSESIVCKNGGYRHPRDCNRCKCTDFHEGQFCEIERGVIDLGLLNNQTIIHNNTGGDWTPKDPNNWDNFQKDPVHVIKAPANRRIRVTIENQKFSGYKQTACGFMAVEIADGDLGLTGKKYCQTQWKNINGSFFISKSNVIGYRAYSILGFPAVSVLTFSLEPESDEPTTPTTTSTITPTPTTTTASSTTTTTSSQPDTTTTTTETTTTTTESQPETTTTTTADPTTTTTTTTDATTTTNDPIIITTSNTEPDTTTTTSDPPTTTPTPDSTTTSVASTTTAKIYPPKPLLPKPDFANGKCGKALEFTFDERSKLCLAKATEVCNEEQYQAAQEKSYANCKKNPDVIPDPPRHPCNNGLAHERVPGEPDDALYGKICAHEFCNYPYSICVQGAREKAHCCVFPYWS